jgi:hypothetical protein
MKKNVHKSLRTVMLAGISGLILVAGCIPPPSSTTADRGAPNQAPITGTTGITDTTGVTATAGMTAATGVTEDSDISITAVPSYSEDQVDTDASLARIRAHLLASLAVWETGDFEAAATHASHAPETLNEIDAAMLQDQDMSESLSTALDDYVALAGAAGDADQVRTSHQVAMEAITTTEEALFGSLLVAPTFQGEVMAALLGDVADHYEAAVDDNQINDVLEYQTAAGLVTVAVERFNTFAETIETGSPDDYERIAGWVSILQESFADPVQPSGDLTSPEAVEAAADVIHEELRTVFGLSDG